MINSVHLKSTTREILMGVVSGIINRLVNGK